MPRPANPDVRNRLCSAGGDLIRRTSFGATGIQEITSAARVPKGSFYNYFDSKDSYATEILDDYWRTIDESCGETLRDRSLPPLQAVRDFFVALIEYHAERQFIPGCLVGNLALELAATSDLVRDKLRRLFTQWTAELAARVTEARQAGALPPDVNPEQVAAGLIDAFEGAVLRAKVDQGQAALKRFQEFVLPRLLG
jgi:TetR/AcrR family transcriptional repressor of nem operon